MGKIISLFQISREIKVKMNMKITLLLLVGVVAFASAAPKGTRVSWTYFGEKKRLKIANWFIEKCFSVKGFFQVLQEITREIAKILLRF